MKSRTEPKIEVPTKWNRKKDVTYYRRNAEWDQEGDPHDDSWQAIETEAAYLELVLDGAIRYFAHRAPNTAIYAPVIGVRPKIDMVKRLVAQASSDQQSPAIECLQMCEEAVALRDSMFQKLQTDPSSVWLFEMVELFGTMSDAYFYLFLEFQQQYPDFRAVLQATPVSMN